MTRDHYVIENSKRKSRADTSFRACILTLLAFILLCVIVLIILQVTKNNATSSRKDGGNANSLALADEERRRSDSSPTVIERDRSAREYDGSETERSTKEPTSTLSTTEETVKLKSSHEDEKERTPPASESPATYMTSTESATGRVKIVHDVDVVIDTIDITSPSSEKNSTESSTITERNTEGPFPAGNATKSTADEIEVSTAKEVESKESILHTLPGSDEHPVTTTHTPAVESVPCMSVECKEVAANMLNTMGHGARPCKHFYEYACGGLRRRRNLLQTDYISEALLRIRGQINKISDSDPASFKKFKILEKSCNNYDPHNDKGSWKRAVLEEMSNIGSISKNEETFSPNFTHLFVGLLKHDRPVIFEVSLDINDRNPKKFAIKIFPASMVIDQMNPEDSDIMECQTQAAEKHKNINTIYEETKKCLNNGNGKRKKLETARKALERLNIFDPISELALFNETLSDYEKFLDLNAKALGDNAARHLELENRDPELKTIDELNDLFKELNVNWSTIIENLLGRLLKDGEAIQLYSDIYFRKMSEIPMSKRQLHNSLLVAFVVERYRDLVEAQQLWRGTQPILHCTRLAALLLPDVASALYLRSFEKTELTRLQLEVEKTYNEVRMTYKDEIGRASWLNEKENLRNGLIHKLNQILLINITSDTSIKDSSKLDEDLVEYNLDEMEYVRNAVLLMKRNRKRLYERMDKNPVDCVWSHFIAPYDVGGISLYSLQVIVIPLGAVQKPFFSPNYPPHIKMAGLGFILAHEVAHHLDTIGVNFDVPSNDWDIKEYLMVLPTFNIFKHDVNIEYLNETDYKKHTDLNFTFTDIHGNLKNNELLSDKIGIMIAHKAFEKYAQREKTQLTLPFVPESNNQSFFLFLAQNYCTKLDFSSTIVDFFESPVFPAEVRVEQMMDNRAFQRAFKCSTEAPDLPFPYSVHVEEIPDYP